LHQAILTDGRPALGRDVPNRRLRLSPVAVKRDEASL
jgi:hypothetical protein